MMRRVDETPDDFTTRINRGDVRLNCVRVINRAELPIRQQKPVLRAIGVAVPSDDVSGRANSSRVSVGHARVVKGNEIRLGDANDDDDRCVGRAVLMPMPVLILLLLLLMSGALG